MGGWLRRRRLTRTLRREARRCLGLLFAVAFLAGLAGAGARYFYCPFMDVVASEHCCAGQGREPVTTVRPSDCCEAEIFGALPAARTTAPAPDLPSAACIAVLAPVLDVPSSELSPAVRPSARSGLSPPPARRSSQQIVLRT